MSVRVSDHALVRFLDRAGGLDVEGLRTTIEFGLERADIAARRLRIRSYDVKADGLVYRVRAGTLVTVLSDDRRRR